MKALVTEYVRGAYYGGDIKTIVDVPDNTEESLKYAVVKAIFKTDESDNYEIILDKDETDGVYHVTSVEIKCKDAGRFVGSVLLDVCVKVELI